MAPGDLLPTSSENFQYKFSEWCLFLAKGVSLELSSHQALNFSGSFTFLPAWSPGEESNFRKGRWIMRS